jgi:hypothetical protein
MFVNITQLESIAAVSLWLWMDLCLVDVRFFKVKWYFSIFMFQLSQLECACTIIIVLCRTSVKKKLSIWPDVYNI